MKAIPLRLSDELHKTLKVKVATEETSMQQYIIKLIEKDLKENK